MSQVKQYTGEKLAIQIGNGADPEVFAHDCLINTERGVSYNSQTSESYLPDCDDLDLPAARSLEVTGLSTTITGSGVMHSSSWKSFFEWWQSGTSKNVKVYENGVSVADGGGSEVASYKLTSLERSGSHKEAVTVSITLESDGPVVRMDHSA